MYRGEIRKKAQPLIKKFKEKGYSRDAYMIMGFLVFGKDNDGNEYAAIDKSMELLDKCKNETEFIKGLTKYFDL